MQDLIQELKEKAGLTEEQAIKALHTIKDYIQSKLPPMMHGLIDNFLGEQFKTSGDGDAQVHHSDINDFMDKAGEVTKQAAEKIENITEEVKKEIKEFANKAGEQTDKWTAKAGETAQEAIDKLKNMLEEQKKHGKTE